MSLKEAVVEGGSGRTAFSKANNVKKYTGKAKWEDDACFDYKLKPASIYQLFSMSPCAPKAS